MSTDADPPDVVEQYAAARPGLTEVTGRFIALVTEQDRYVARPRVGHGGDVHNALVHRDAPDQRRPATSNKDLTPVRVRAW